MKKKEGVQMEKNELQRRFEPAPVQTIKPRRIPWQHLLEVRDQYIDRQASYLWVRSTLEGEDGVPGWLVEILDVCCPGFFEVERALHSRRGSLLL